MTEVRQNTPTMRPVGNGGAPTSHRGRILLVEDDEQLARGMARSLTGAGFVVETAHDGARAGELVLRGGFDAMVSDISLPGGTGLDLLRTIRAYDLDLPVILNTGDPSIKTAMEAVQLGAIQYLVKPVELTVLHEAVVRAVGLHRLARLKREALRMVGAGGDVPGDRAGLDVRFERALAGLYMAFQPIVDLHDRKVFGYEALMRSSEPSLPSPIDIVHAAERLDRVYDMGARVRELTIARFADLVDSEALLFINLHTSELMDASLYASASPLHAFAHRVVLEVTERSAIDAIVDVRIRVAVLRFHGFRLAIDDLGAGYAGLTSFVTLEPEIVKLDMSLIREIETSPLRQELVRSIVELCHQFRMRVIAEGVETVGELNAARAAGCDYAQGYLLGRPAASFAAASAVAV